MGVCCRRLQYAFGIIFGLVALTLAAVGYATNYWIEFDVDRSDLTDVERITSEIDVNLGLFSFTRNRGLFLECYPDDNPPWLSQSDDVVNSDCFERDFEDPDHIDVSDAFSTRLKLLIAVVAVFAIGLLFGVIAILIGLVAVVKQTAKHAFIAAFFALLTGITIASAVAIFLGVDYMEREGSGDDGELIFRKNWSDTMDNATSASFSWSFGLSWAAVGLSLISCVLYFLVGCHHFRKDDDNNDSDNISLSLSYSTSDKQSLDRKRSKRRMEYPYALNDAYLGVNPVYWAHNNQGRAVLAISDSPSDRSNPGQYVYPKGNFFLGPDTAQLPRVGYIGQPPRQPSPHDKHRDRYA